MSSFSPFDGHTSYLRSYVLQLPDISRYFQNPALQMFFSSSMAWQAELARIAENELRARQRSLVSVQQTVERLATAGYRQSLVMQLAGYKIRLQRVEQHWWVSDGLKPSSLRANNVITFGPHQCILAHEWSMNPCYPFPKFAPARDFSGKTFPNSFRQQKQLWSVWVAWMILEDVFVSMALQAELSWQAPYSPLLVTILKAAGACWLSSLMPPPIIAWFTLGGNPCFQSRGCITRMHMYTGKKQARNRTASHRCTTSKSQF